MLIDFSIWSVFHGPSPFLEGAMATFVLFLFVPVGTIEQISQFFAETEAFKFWR